jgi:hypothetical protein
MDLVPVWAETTLGITMTAALNITAETKSSRADSKRAEDGIGMRKRISIMVIFCGQKRYLQLAQLHRVERWIGVLES